MLTDPEYNILFVWSLFVLTFSNPFSCFLGSGLPLCSFKICIQDTFKISEFTDKRRNSFYLLFCSPLHLGLVDRKCLAASVTVPLARIVGFARSAQLLGVQTISILVLVLLLTNFRRELYSPENLLVQCSGWNQWQGKIWDTWPQGFVKIKISLPGLSNPAPWFWFSSFLVSCLAGECYKRCEISFRWASGQSVSSAICAPLLCCRNSQERPTKAGLGAAGAVCEEQQEQGCSWNAAAAGCALPAQPRAVPWVQHTKGSAGLGGWKASKPAAVKEFCVGSESQDGLICSQRTQRGVYLGRMNSSTGYQWLCFQRSSTNVLQNNSYLLEHNPLRECGTS